MRFKGSTESTVDLATGIVDDAQKLVRLEIQLAKIELKEMAVRNAAAAGLLIFAATLLMIGLLVAGPLALVLLGGHWWWALVWLGADLLLAGILAMVGMRLLKLKPQRTMDSLQETKAWVSDLTSSRAR